MDRTFEPTKRIRGVVRVPGDKAISHRAAILAGMAKGSSRLTGLNPGRDVAATLDCLGRLGVPARRHDSALMVEGPGWEVASHAHLEAENSGTTMRLLPGALAGRPGEFVITGDESLSKRPMDRIAEPLRLMGARVDLAEKRFPPVRIAGGPLTGISYEMPVPSGQVKGAILLAGLQAEGKTTVVEKYQARDHTERLLGWLDARLERSEGRLTLHGGALPLRAFDLSIPGDFSSAAYWVVAALLVSDGDLVIEGVGINPSRTGLLDVLAGMGAQVEVEVSSADPEPAGTIRSRSTGELGATTVEGETIVRTIDELSLVALAALRAEGTTVVRDAGELRVKESDRVAVLAEGLRALGASIEEAPDGFAVTGPAVLGGGRVDPAGDHRMAMTFAVAGLIAAEPVTVAGWECAEVSYPRFEDDLRAITG